MGWPKGEGSWGPRADASLGKRTERVRPPVARGSPEMGLAMIPLGGAELPTCRPGARWRGLGVGLLEGKGEGSRN